jgi:PAS domain-containing protein
MDIASYALEKKQAFLAYLLRMAATEAYDVADDEGFERLYHTRINPGALHIGVWDLDVSSNINFADETCAEFFGVSASKAVRGVANMNFERALHPDDRTRVLGEVGHALTTGSRFQSEYRLIIGDRMRWVHAKGFCTLGKSGRPERFPGTVIDITGFKSGVH